VVVLALRRGCSCPPKHWILGGPAVLSNWQPTHGCRGQFPALSTGLVTQNGVLVMGVSAALGAAWSKGSVALLVVLYSINVLFDFQHRAGGAGIYWWSRRPSSNWRGRLLLSGLGAGRDQRILLVLVIGKILRRRVVTLTSKPAASSRCASPSGATIRNTESIAQDRRSFLDARPAGRSDAPAAARPQQPHRSPFRRKNRGVGTARAPVGQRLFRSISGTSVPEAGRGRRTRANGGRGALRTLQYEIENSLRYSR